MMRDLDPSFNFDADPDPAPHQSDEKWLHNWASRSSRLFTLMRIRIQLSLHFDADPDPDPASQNDANPCGSGLTTLDFTNRDEGGALVPVSTASKYNTDIEAIMRIGCRALRTVVSLVRKIS